MPITWAEATTQSGDPEHDDLLRHLHQHGVLALAEQLMNEDRRGITRPSVTLDEAHALMAGACQD